MKLIIPAILLSVVIKAHRLLQTAQSPTCATIKCGLGGPCYDNPYSNTAICCAADDICAYPQDYIDQPIAVCPDGNEYPSKCHGYCSGQKPSECHSICECDPTSTDCGNGYECLETPFGFAGCDENIGNSCFGFCVAVGDECGGAVGLSLCQQNEQCFYTTNNPNGNNIGYCGSLPSDCTVTPTNPSCGGFENCATYFDGCNGCDCGVDGTGFPPRCTKIACSPDEYKTAYCSGCREGYVLDETTGKCIIPSCGGIPYCKSYKPDSCNSCGCSDISTDLARCTLQFCGPQDPANYECTNCIDGYQLNGNKECEKCDAVLCKAAPCDVTTCAAYPDAMCENDYCGGCNAIFTDRNGNVLTADDCRVDSITCANIDCLPGDNCYDFSAGSTCCDPTVCVEGPKCGNIGDNPCKLGYECINGVCIRLPNSCASTTCIVGESCYETSNGAICCDPNVCIEGPKCGNIGDNPCKLGYECINGVCIRLPLPSTDCGGFANCAAYNDGCNDCICGVNGKSCTEKACDPRILTKPRCTACKAGYKLNDANECIAEPIICGGFDNCASYNDGCNNCICSDSGFDGCTKKLCPPDSITKPYCTSCKSGYRLNVSTGECVEKITCETNKDCETDNGFKCRKDPECRAEKGQNKDCQEVCADIERSRMCVNDGDCDKGYNCVALGNGSGICVKYQ